MKTRILVLLAGCCVLAMTGCGASHPTAAAALHTQRHGPVHEEWFVGSNANFAPVVRTAPSTSAYESTYLSAPLAGPFSTQGAAQAAAAKLAKSIDKTKRYIKAHPAPTTTSDASGSGSGSGSTQAGATYSYSGDGNSVQQTVLFGSPQTGTQTPTVINAAQGCTGGSQAPDQDLVVPVQVQTSLTSSIAVDLTFVMGYTLVSGPEGGLGPQPLSPAAFVYETQGQQYTCTDESNDNGFDVSLNLSEGDTATSNVWIVLPGAVSPDYPRGNQGSLGMTGAFASLGISGGWQHATVSGAGVCTGGSPVSSSGAAYWLHIGAKVRGWEHCGRTVNLMDS